MTLLGGQFVSLYFLLYISTGKKVAKVTKFSKSTNEVAKFDRDKKAFDIKVSFDIMLDISSNSNKFKSFLKRQV